MRNLKKILVLSVLLAAFFSVTACAEAAFSKYWAQDSAGTWHIHDASGRLITNAWLCDDAVPANGQNIWYLIDAEGNMISAGLVQDGTGNYYSLEMNHEGHFGMLRYESRQYTADGLSVNLSLESSHGGSFAAIKNQDGIETLKNKYGLTKVNIDNSNIVYTSKLEGGQAAPAQNAASTQAPAGALTEADFLATGNSVPERNLLSYLRSGYTNDAAVYFYYDSSVDESRESVVKTARGITLASTKADVVKAYGEGKTVSMSSPKDTKAIQIAYGFDPNGITGFAKSCLRYQTADGKYAMYFCFKDNGQVSYIFYYLT